MEFGKYELKSKFSHKFQFGRAGQSDTLEI
jgi:hypothetical protein